MVQREVRVAERLRLDALGGVHHEDCALTGGKRPGDFIVEVDVAGSVDEVQVIDLPVLRLVLELDGTGFDRDPAFSLDVHVVEELFLHLPFGDGLGQLQHAVGQRGFPVVDMGDDREVADVVSVV